MCAQRSPGRPRLAAVFLPLLLFAHALAQPGLDGEELLIPAMPGSGPEDPTPKLESDFRYIANGIGPAACAVIVPVIQGVSESKQSRVEYKAPSKLGSSGDFVTVPSDSFSINGVQCEGSHDWGFQPEPRRPDPGDASPWATLSSLLLDPNAGGAMRNTSSFCHGRVLANEGEDPVGTLVEEGQDNRAFTGCTVQISDDEETVIRIHEMILFTSLIDRKLPTPDPQQVIVMEPGQEFLFLELDTDVADGPSSVCLFERVELADSDGAKDGNSASDATSSDAADDDSESQSTALTGGEIAGIAVGIVAVVIAVGVVLTGAHCWKRRVVQDGAAVAAVDGDDDDDQDRPHAQDVEIGNHVLDGGDNLHIPPGSEKPDMGAQRLATPSHIIEDEHVHVEPIHNDPLRHENVQRP